MYPRGRLASACALRLVRPYATGALRVSDGARTRDRPDHNQRLYQLSYRHHAGLPLEEQVESTTMVTRRPRAPLLPSISRESDICLG